MNKKWYKALGTLGLAGSLLLAYNTAAQAEDTAAGALSASDGTSQLTKQTITDTKTAADTAVYANGLTVSFPSKVQAGDTGKLDFAFDLEDITFSGSYVLYYDAAKLKIDEKGNWEALTAGAVTVLYGYQPADEMLKELTALAADKENDFANEQSFAQTTVAISEKDSTKTATADKKLTSNGMTITFPTTVTVGDTGEFKPEISFADDEQKYTGDYTFYYDPEFLKVDKDGKWEALTSGTTSVLYAYDLTDKLTAELPKDAVADDAGTISYESRSIVKKADDTTKDDKTGNDHADARQLQTSRGITLKDFPEKANVGDTGTFKASIDMTQIATDNADYSGITADGEFAFSYDDSLFLIEKKDDSTTKEIEYSWLALHKGDVSVNYSFVPSTAMLTEMSAVAQKAGHDGPVFETDLKSKAVTVSRTNNFEFYQGVTVKGAKTAKVGDSGTFEVLVSPTALNTDKIKFDNITFEGDVYLKSQKNLVTVDEKYNWKADKAGEESFTLSWAPSDKMLAEMLKVIYASGEAFATKDIAEIYEMTITEAAGTTTTSSSAAAGKNTTLPQTGEQSTSWLAIGAGVILIGGVIFIIYRKRQAEK